MTTSITARDAERMIRDGALLVDIREPDEYARSHIPGALNIPLAKLDGLETGERLVLFHCRSGARTQGNAALLAQASGDTPCYIVEGGLEAWAKAGLPVAKDKSQPLEIMRQVQLGAGGLVLIGVILGFLVAPGFFGLSAFVGAGLMMAGATGWCGLARVLRVMPWNRAALG